MIQGDVCFYIFKEPDKRRPVLILTRDDGISKLNQITVAAITTTIRNNASEVLLNEDDGLFEECVVNLDQIQTVEKRKLGKIVTHLSPERMREVRKAIEFAFNLDKL